MTACEARKGTSRALAGLFRPLSLIVMPIITLLTDYGTADSYVGEVKGVLLSLAPGCTVIDLTHEVSPGDVAGAAYVLARTWSRYPEGTVHLVIVDPGVGTTRAALALRVAGQGFVGPDNGLLGALADLPGLEAVELTVPARASNTFHGRDVFAPAAAALARGVPLGNLGVAYRQAPVRLPASEPVYEGKTVIGEVTYVDRYGNLATNLTTAVVPPYAILEVESLVIGPLKGTFNDVPPGGLVAYVGSGGCVEIAVRGGSAARRLGLGVGGKIRARLG